jgi:co-chaperonin GroES (HSP10)
MALEALQNKVCVIQDEFRSGNECKRCGGVTSSMGLEEKTTITCEDCGGTGMRTEIKKCPNCDGGRIVCPDCNGKGGLIVTPESSKTRPNTGRVYSVGPDVKIIKVGDYVMYTNFAGTGFNIKDCGQIVILSEQEIVGRLYAVESAKLGQAVL